METINRTFRNVLGFLCGWLFVMALAFGMEAAHALEFKMVGNGNPWNFEFVGSSGSDLCEQLRASKQSTANSNQTFTVESSASLSRTTVSGQCKIKASEPCYIDYTGHEFCNSATYTPGAAYYSRCTSADPWVLITASAAVCPVPQCQPTTELDSPVATGVMVNDSASSTMCQAECQISPFSTDDNSSITTTPLGGQPATIRGNSSTRWKITGVCPTSELEGAQAEVNAEKCQTVQGEAVCTGGSTPKNCVKINGGLSCTSDAGGVCTDASCTSAANALKNPDGSATAKSTEPTPTAPNTGTAGQRATPDLSYSQTRNDGFGGSGSTNGYDWFSQGTVAGSYNGDGSIGDQATEDGGGGTGGECDPATETCPCDPVTQDCPGEDPGGSGDCDPATQDCSPSGNSGGVKGPGGTARGFGESIAAISTAWNASPAVTKINALEIPSGGSCPSPTIDLPYLHTSITMDAHCTIAAGIRGQLRAIFLALWVIIAVGIFLRP